MIKKNIDKDFQIINKSKNTIMVTDVFSANTNKNRSITQIFKLLNRNVFQA